jgi:O-antigen ligase
MVENPISYDRTKRKSVIIKMEKEKQIGQMYSHFLGLFSAIFLIFPKYSSFAILAWVLVILFGTITKKFTFQFTKSHVFFIGLYVIYAIGVIFTDHMDIAGKYLEYKLAFILLPLLFLYRPKVPVGISIVVLWGVVASAVLFGLSCYHSYQCGTETICWLSSSFSYIHHPTYLSCFFSFYLMFALYGYFKKWRSFKLIWIVPFVILATIGMLFCFSFGEIVVFLILLVVLAFYYLNAKWSWKIAWPSLLFFIILAWLFLSRTPQIRDDWQAVKKITGEFVKNPEEFIKTRKYPFSGTEVRLVMWTASVQTILTHPLGSGTGNVDDYLKKTLLSYDQVDLARQEYNPHNQYLQIGVELGVAGLLFLLILLAYFFVVSVKNKNFMLFVLLFTFSLNFFMESMLQRQSGIIFFTFWVCLFTVKYPAVVKE